MLCLIFNLAGRKMDYIIITGGVSNMDGFSAIASSVFGKDVRIGNVNIIGIRDNMYSSAIGNIAYYINKLKLVGEDYSMIEEEIDFSKDELVVSNDSMLEKVFGYFFGETNKEEI